MKVLQKLAILIKNLCLSKQYGARRLLSELPDKARKLGSIDNLLKRIHKTGTRPRSARCQEDKRKRHRSPEISHETAFFSVQVCAVISSSNASNDVVFSCCLKLVASRFTYYRGNSTAES